MSKATFRSAYIYKEDLRVELLINGKSCQLSDIPVSNELIKELTALFKRHLPKVEDI